MVPGETVDAFKNKVSPLQMGLMLIIIGLTGVLSTTTETVSAADVQPLSVAVTLYWPTAAVVTFDIETVPDGLLLKAFGPDHVKLTPGVVEVADKLSVPPLHKGEAAAEATGTAGGLGSVKLTDATAAEAQPDSVTVMLV